MARDGRGGSLYRRSSSGLIVPADPTADEAQRRFDAIMKQLSADQRRAAQLAVRQHQEKARRRRASKTARASRKANRD